MDKRVILAFFFVNIIYVWSTPHLAHLMNKRDIYCGPKLTETLALVCQGKYNSPSKKSITDLMAYNEYDELFPSESDEDSQLDFPFLQKETANSFLPIRLRRKVGIVDECCKKPCSIRHLSLYCA
ncbi:LIRP [Asbolus verrucosus]|uniref:LIRP n=1 Tax=Asbolus verrucosus TaxID=1661398 RepID=A0A482W8C7_ASBVE|nr:LIRP [Asbolus verrucosus]